MRPGAGPRFHATFLQSGGYEAMRIKNICNISFRITFLLSMVLYFSESIQAQLPSLPAVTSGVQQQALHHTAGGMAC
jgi:hypothetical protein